MKTVFLALLFFVASAVQPAFGQETSDAELERNLRAHVAYLTSVRTAGRRTGEGGASLAAEYIAGQFKKLKLKSPGVLTGGNYRQVFPYVTGVVAAAGGSEFRLGLNGDSPRPIAGGRPVAFSPNAAVGVSPIVFANFGIVAAEQNRDDYAGVDVRGKIVIVFDAASDESPHSPLARFDARTKALIARDRGAAGMLIVSREQRIDDDKLARMTFDQTAGESALPTLVVSRDVAASVLGIDAGSLDSLEKGKLQRAGGDAPASAQFKIALVRKTSPAYNIAGVLEGSDPVLKNEIVVVGAHYDHLGRGGQGSLDANSTAIHPGADDNASGAAALIEIARRFAAARTSKRTLVFIAFSGEEEGLLGSQYYVSNPLFPLEKTVAMINLDMIGRLNENKLSVGGIGTAEDWKTLVETSNPRTASQISVGSSIGMSLSPFFKLQLNEDGFGPSDHSSFYGKKIPVLFFFTGTHNDYHKPSDTAEKINYQGQAAITGMVFDIVAKVGSRPARPVYAVAKSSGSMGGRSGFNISLGTIPNYADSSDGLVLDGVRDNSPAFKAGVRAGDKVVKLAGRDIRNVTDYTYVLGEMRAGTEYEIIVVRGSDRLTFKIVPVKR